MSIGDRDDDAIDIQLLDIFPLRERTAKTKKTKKIQKSNKLRNKLNGRDIDGDVFLVLVVVVHTV